ncbi:ligase-associated DNA damage response endonuclease PdeM [Methylocystis sp. IM3]|uniref:ligase-associated DNA damage response endonuclease PdeM n=1 Tax=unclassified Methylocystis TaxID=2625913 RepID=UPI000FB2F456|nr:MAG: ligase-associated DNA damage response endonuclease PdeM [Hyphomicrobiales bacterium]
MNPDAASYRHRGLVLLPQRAVWQAETRTLWIADLHLGKAASFRALGQPVPRGTTQENLARLGALADAHAARRLVVLGDFLHGRLGRNAGLFAQLRGWREARADLDCIVVRGNHDAQAGDAPAECGFTSVDEPFALDGVEGWHEARVSGAEDGPTILAGHLHPVARLSGPGRDRLRLPCYCLRGREIVLPAFGEFTGGHPVDPCDWRQLVVTTGTRLFPVPR